MNWFDKYELVHLNPDPTPTDSENGPLFTAHYYSYGGDHEREYLIEGTPISRS